MVGSEGVQGEQTNGFSLPGLAPRFPTGSESSAALPWPCLPFTSTSPEAL